MWRKFCVFNDMAIDQFVPVGLNKSKKTRRWMSNNIIIM